MYSSQDRECTRQDAEVSPASSQENAAFHLGRTEEKRSSHTFDLFLNTFEAKYSAVVECVREDREVLLTLYDFPAENWCHIRATNSIQSTFATIRLRHRKTKNNGSAKASLVIIFKLAQSAAKGWRNLRGHQHTPEKIKNVRVIEQQGNRTFKWLEKLTESS